MLLVKDRLEHLARMGGFANVSALARRAGISEGAMRQHISRGKIPHHRAVQYVDACPGTGATTDWLMHGKGAQPVRSLGGATGSDSKIVLLENHPKGTVSAARPNGLKTITGDISGGSAISRSMVQDLPVYGAADAGGGVVSLSQEPDFHVDRPTWSKSAQDFSFFVLTDALGPHPGRGDRVEVNTTIPPVAGDLVVLISGDREKDWKAVLRELVTWTDSHWRMKQYRPEKVDNFDRATWHTAFKVSGIHKR